MASTPALRPLALLLTLALAGCGEPPKGGSAAKDDAPVVTVRDVEEVAIDLLEDGSFERRAERPDAPIAPGQLAPGATPSDIAVPQFSLMMPPPAELAFRVPGSPGDAGRYVFQTSFGLDFDATTDRIRKRVAFEVLVDGELVDEVLVGWHAKDEGTAARWFGFSDEAQLEGGLQDRLEVPAGAEVVVRSRVDHWGADGEPTAIPAGLSLPRLVHLEPREVRAATPERPNVVFVVMDTLRQDRLGCYGYETAQTPHLDALAERGLVYDDAHATSSWTWPSTASMLTGLLPEQHQVLDTSSCYLKSSIETLPEVMRRGGYATGAFSGNPLITPRRNFQQGFDDFQVDLKAFQRSAGLMPDILDWIDERAEQRFFLYLQLVDTHDPYFPVEPFDEGLAEAAPPGYPTAAVLEYGKLLRARFATEPNFEEWVDETMEPAAQEHMSRLYDACVTSADYWVGEVLGKLEELGISDNTLVVFTSDHGEELLDHGLLGHGQNLRAELTRVPLILAGPGVEPGRVARLVSNMDLAPTLGRLASGSLPAGAQDLLDPANLADQAVFVSSRHGVRGGGHTQLYGVRRDGWLYVSAPEAWEPHRREYLFDLDQDPAELKNLIDEDAGRAAQLQQLVERRRERSEEESSGAGLAAGKDTADLFEQIGYTGD